LIAACPECLRRAWLVARLSPNLDRARERWGSLESAFALGDADLIAALGGAGTAALRAAYAAHDPHAAAATCEAAGLDAVCRHDSRYPRPLAQAPDAPAMLHVAGGLSRLSELAAAPAVALVGARRATPYGVEVARMLGRGLGAAGVTVVSGMALGVDSAAHDGALVANGGTVAVLAGGADVPYPRSKRQLHGRLVADACVVSELPPGTPSRRWGFPARNRLIAGLSQITVVVEAAERSGSLITARVARELGREVAAVPGRITAPSARGANDLICDGAHPIRGVEDLLDLLFGPGGGRERTAAQREAPVDQRLRAVLDAVADGRDTLAALARTPAEAEGAMIALAELELSGHLRRGVGGRYVPVG